MSDSKSDRIQGKNSKTKQGIFYQCVNFVKSKLDKRIRIAIDFGLNGSTYQHTNHTKCQSTIEVHGALAKRRSGGRAVALHRINRRCTNSNWLISIINSNSISNWFNSTKCKSNSIKSYNRHRKANNTMTLRAVTIHKFPANRFSRTKWLAVFKIHRVALALLQWPQQMPVPMIIAWIWHQPVVMQPLPEHNGGTRPARMSNRSINKTKRINKQINIHRRTSISKRYVSHHFEMISNRFTNIYRRRNYIDKWKSRWIAKYHVAPIRLCHLKTSQIDLFD